MQSIVRGCKGRTALVLLVGMLIGGMGLGQAAAEQLTWESDFAFIYFDWNGTWDKTAYWAYGLWCLDVPDWAYLFAVYGMGWTDIWGPRLWGDDGTWGAEDKFDIYLVNAGSSRGTSFGAWHTINVNVDALESLDLSGGWIDQVCSLGRSLAYRCTTGLVDDLGISESGSVWLSSAVLGVSLGLHVRSVLWPWGVWNIDLPLIQYGYTTSHPGGTYEGYTWWLDAFNTWLGSDEGFNTSVPNYGPSLWTMYAWGFLLEDFDHQIFGAADAGGASSISRIATLLKYWYDHNGQEGWVAQGWMAAYGHLGTYFGGGSDFRLKVAYGDLNAYLYYLMWGEWYV